MADWQVDVRSLTLGDDDYILGEVEGLGTPEARTADVQRGDRDGDVGGADVLERRVITLPVTINSDDPGDAWALLDALKLAFRPSAADVELTLRLPDIERGYFGRPRGVVTDLGTLGQGAPRALCTFVCLDPLGYGDAVTASVSGALTLDNIGTYRTDRCALTVNASAAAPEVVNTDDANGRITWATAFTGTRVINLRDRTVVDGSGNDCYPELAASSTWFVLRPGENDLTITAGSSMSAVFRPAYL